MKSNPVDGCEILHQLETLGIPTGNTGTIMGFVGGC